VAEVTEAELRAFTERVIADNRSRSYQVAVAGGARLFGGHLGTCDALFGAPECNCGKPKEDIRGR
jgi:hypothetical protein